MCGKSECASFHDPGTLDAFNSAEAEGQPASATYYRARILVELDAGKTDSWRVLYNPARNVVRTTDETGALV